MDEIKKPKIAIVGVGQVGITVAEEISKNRAINILNL